MCTLSETTTNQSLDSKRAVFRSFPFRNSCEIQSHGSRWEYQIQKGLSVSCLRIKPENDLKLEYEKDQPTLNFGFILSGRVAHQVKAPGLIGQEFLGLTGTSGIMYHSRQEGTLTVPGQTENCIVHIHLSLSFFSDLFHTEEGSVPKALKPLLDGPVEKSYAVRFGMSPRVKSVLERLVKGPSPGAPYHLFYHGIALDLIVEQISRANWNPPKTLKLSNSEQNRVIHAREMLTQDLSEPPCLRQLSRMTGMNMNKLQQGFYLLYGVSVFKYFQQYRMWEANRLFRETDMNVSQAAVAVGYSNISHFSNAYKKQFGILPKKHMLCIKGDINNPSLK